MQLKLGHVRLEFNHRTSEQKLKACQEKLELERIYKVWLERSKV